MLHQLDQPDLHSSIASEVISPHLIQSITPKCSPMHSNSRIAAENTQTYFDQLEQCQKQNSLFWKVYKGYKKSTRQEAAIFVFEKRLIERWDKNERELMLEKLRRGISQLTRLRHPQVLTVQHPLEESRDSLAFATEPVFASLANVLGNTENMPAQLPSALNNFKLYDVEIKYGLMQLSEGLAFLHNSVKTVHRNICPENIILNHQGAWKLFGFDFCTANSAAADQPPYWSFEEYNSGMHPYCQPNLDYLSPEYALTHTLDPSADMFSLGVVIYSIFNDGHPIFHNSQNFSTFKRNSCELKNNHSIVMENIPNELQEKARLLLHSTPQLRPDALQFSKISYFDDVGVKTLSYLDQMFQWDNLQKSQFYKGLPQIIPQLPHRVVLLRIVPCLVKEFVNATMVPFVLPVLLLVAEKASKEEFVTHILPALTPIMKLTEPIQVMLQLMQNMELLLTKTPPENVKNDVMPLIYRALECDIQQIQELCLSIIPMCASHVEFPAMKNSLLPRIKKLCLHTGYLSVRVNSLVCLGKLLEHLDKWLVLDEVLPFLSQVPSREAPVIMAIVGIYKVSLTHKKLGISKEVLATKVLPFLFPLSIESSLTLAQHAGIMSLIKDMTERIEVEHRAKLEQLNSIKDEQHSLQLSASVTKERTTGSSSESSSEVDKMFSNMGLDQYTKPSIGSNADQQNYTAPPSSVPVLASSFTLEDKQRMAKEQAVGEILRKQPPLLPAPPPPAVSVTKPQSSTMSSTNSFATPLSQFESNHLSNSNGPLSVSRTDVTSISKTSPLTTSSSSIMQSSPFLPPVNNNWGMNAVQQTPYQQRGMNAIKQTQFQQSNFPQPTIGKPNLSAFDTLLPSQPKPISMNQMQQQRFNINPSGIMPGTTINSTGTLMPMNVSPMIPNSTSLNVKPLSSSDINDLLS
ncbi:SCY1-like protein 2 isoform X2 [Oratosquilla oratoria]|uniref:SCY1-like protein 2 isoform X2 n=1 Tax=Oratosquilla oratoria TaxID=337810 RepID=UPI003F75E407